MTSPNQGMHIQFTKAGVTWSDTPNNALSTPNNRKISQDLHRMHIQRAGLLNCTQRLSQEQTKYNKIQQIYI